MFPDLVIIVVVSIVSMVIYNTEIFGIAGKIAVDIFENPIVLVCFYRMAKRFSRVMDGGVTYNLGYVDEEMRRWLDEDDVAKFSSNVRKTATKTVRDTSRYLIVMTIIYIAISLMLLSFMNLSTFEGALSAISSTIYSSLNLIVMYALLLIPLTRLLTTKDAIKKLRKRIDRE